MESHLLLLVLFSLFVSAVFAGITGDTPTEQLRAGLRLFGLFVVSGLALGWVLYLFPL